MITRESKRIDMVTVKRILDDDGDSSHLGEFSDTPNDYAIVHIGEHAGTFERDLPCECSHSEDDHNNNGQCMDICECEDFDQVTVERGREYRYFNPPIDNYEGVGDEEMRKYCQQDYERAKGLGSDWWFIGIEAEARISIPNGNGSTLQTITSGGLWGIESDSEADYFTEVANEELSQLKDQLHAIGFSKRAITAAFRNVKHENE